MSAGVGVEQGYLVELRREAERLQQVVKKTERALVVLMASTAWEELDVQYRSMSPVEREALDFLKSLVWEK